MDLTKQPPRSPYDELGGYAFLPRAIDKMRALIAGTHGLYNAKVGYSTQLFDLFGVTPDEFEKVVRDNPTDEGVLKALQQRKPHTPQEVEAWSKSTINRSPADEAGWARHYKQLEDAGYGHRRDIKTMADRLDLDDGREVAQGGRHHRHKAGG